MCDQLPVELCKRLTLNELIALENLLIERGDAKRSTISEFLMDILENKRHCTKASDYIKILSEAMRRSYGESPYNLPPGVHRLASKDLIRLGYGCDHAAA